MIRVVTCERRCYHISPYAAAITAFAYTLMFMPADIIRRAYLPARHALLLMRTRRILLRDR